MGRKAPSRVHVMGTDESWGEGRGLGRQGGPALSWMCVGESVSGLPSKRGHVKCFPRTGQTLVGREWWPLWNVSVEPGLTRGCGGQQEALWHGSKLDYQRSYRQLWATGSAHSRLGLAPGSLPKGSFICYSFLVFPF